MPKQKHNLPQVRIKETDWEQVITLDTALAHEITVRSEQRSLQWVGDNHPALLDRLIGTVNPSREPRLFACLVLACEYFEGKIGSGIVPANVDMRAQDERTKHLERKKDE